LVGSAHAINIASEYIKDVIINYPRRL